MRTIFPLVLCFLVAFGIEAQTIKVHKIVSDDNQTIACPELAQLSMTLELMAKGQAADSGAFARNSGCIYLDTTHLVAMTGEYIYEQEYNDSSISLIQAEIYDDEYIDVYWVMKSFFDHPEYTVYMEKEAEQSELVRAAEKMLAVEEAAELEQEKAQAEQKELEAARALHKSKFGEWEYEFDQELGNIISVYNISSESEYDTFLRITYACDGKLFLSGEQLSAQRIRMRFDNSDELNRRWRDHSWTPGTIQLQRVPNPALHGNRLSIKMTYKASNTFQEANITDVATFPIALFDNAVSEYCS